MTGKQIQLLSIMKKLIIQGDKRFASRKDRDYLSELLEIGITEEEAWNEILLLNVSHYIKDYRMSYNKTTDNALTFIKSINDFSVYIKIFIDSDDSKKETVCLSFHISNK